MNINKRTVTFYKNLITSKLVNIFIPVNNKSIYIIPSTTDDMHRYLFLLSKFFTYNGYSVFIQAQFNILKNPKNYLHYLINEKNIRFVKRKPKTKYVLSSNDFHSNEIQLNFNYFNTQPSINTLFFPYTLHPSFYKFNMLSSLNQYRLNKSYIKILFLGASSEQYRHSNFNIFEDRFKIKRRPEVIEHLVNNFTNIHIFDNSNQIYEWIGKQNKQKIEFTIINTTKTSVNQNRWLELMSNADFYLALPGITTPLSHNLVEAMSVGCIPILQYGKLIQPNLVNKKDAIFFNDLEDLNKVIKKCLIMSEETITEMKKNVIHLYEQHFTPESFGIKFESFVKSNVLNKQLVINIEKPVKESDFNE